MSQTTINTTDSPETGRVAINANFTDLYATKQDVVSGVSNTEIGYLDGVTSAIQTQINNTIKGILVFGGGAPTNTTRYADPVGSSVKTADYEGQIAVGAGTIKNLRVTILANAGITNYVVTVQKNGVDTTLTTTCAGSGVTTVAVFSDLTHSFTVVNGDLIGIKIVAASTGYSPSYIYYSVEISEV